MGQVRMTLGEQTLAEEWGWEKAQSYEEVAGSQLTWVRRFWGVQCDLMCQLAAGPHYLTRRRTPET